MIEYLQFNITKLDDYDLVKHKLVELRPYANHDNLFCELRSRIGLKCKMILLEQPYRDADFSSVHSLFYAKKHFQVERDCIRLLFFYGDNLETLFGALTVRDSITDSRGRSAFKPEYLIQVNKAYVLQSPHSLNLLGMKYEISGFPWMAQDTDIDVCAHIAVWSIVNYYSQKRENYASKTIGKIVEQTPSSLGRKTPSTGLNLQQMSDILQGNGFYPLVISKEQLGEEEFIQALYSYMESGIPVVAALTTKAHAVVVIGHEQVVLEGLNKHSGLITPDKLISNWIISDDNYLPFQAIGHNGRFKQEDIDFLIIPLAEKMYLNASVVMTRVKEFISRKELNVHDNSVIRIYLTSSKALKRAAREELELKFNEKLNGVIITLPMPQFVWCADIASYSEYAQGLTQTRIIIDSTAGTYEENPWLLRHDDNKVIYRDEKQSMLIDNLRIAPYQLYQNNLVEVNKV